MKRKLITLIMSFFFLTLILNSQALDKYKLMNDIIKDPGNISSICKDNMKIDKYLRKRLKNTQYLNKIESYLHDNFEGYYFSTLDTIVVIKEKGLIHGYRHKIKYMNEKGDIFCFQFYQKVNKEWELISFGDYEVWNPYPKCDDKK